MVRHDRKKPRPEDEVLALEDPVTTDPAEPAPPADEFSARLQKQMQNSQRLNEYYNEVVAELRASLDRIEAEEG
jgi:hypothetical protein